MYSVGVLSELTWFGFIYMYHVIDSIIMMM